MLCSSALETISLNFLIALILLGDAKLLELNDFVNVTPNKTNKNSLKDLKVHMNAKITADTKSTESD